MTEAGSGHTGGSLGLVDVFTVLYFSVLRHNSNDPLWEDRDRLILSIGHVAPVLYASLAEARYFPKEELMTLSGIGESKAKAIISYRSENGLFKSIDDIKNVTGIGDSIFAQIKENITI